MPKMERLRMTGSCGSEISSCVVSIHIPLEERMTDGQILAVRASKGFNSHTARGADDGIALCASRFVLAVSIHIPLEERMTDTSWAARRKL